MNEFENNNTPQGDKFAIASLVLGIVGIIGGWIPIVNYFTTLSSILAIVFAVKAKNMAEDGKSTMATAGLVLGIIALAFSVVGILCVVCAAAATGLAFGF